MLKIKWLFFAVIIVIVMMDIIGSNPKTYFFSIENVPECEKKVFDFVTQKISGPELSIHTNYINEKSYEDTIATGKDVLSESQGLLLLYLLNRDKKEYFDLCLDWTIDNLFLDSGTFSWVKTKKLENKSTNALIDDLRLVRALILAKERWNDKRYNKPIYKSSQALLSYNVEDDTPLDFYDYSSNYKSNCITISYIDLYTMEKLSDIDSAWRKVYNKSYELVKNAKIEGTGLYQFQYNLDQQIFTGEQEICLTQSTYTMLHLAEIGEYDVNGMNWLWSEYEKHGKIYSSYSNTTYEPITDMESTALYALIARLYHLSGDYNKSEIMLKECKKFQVMNKNSEIFGSFGNDIEKEVYSFNNLQYLLSSSIIHKKK